MTAERAIANVSVPITRVRAGEWSAVEDTVAAEEPLEMRLRWQGRSGVEQRSIAVTMRTPGSDFELATGFLFGEGIVRSRDDIIDVSYCTGEGEEQLQNVVLVTLRPGRTFDPARLERNFYTTSSCGVCGKATLEALEVQGCEVLPAEWAVPPGLICLLPRALREAQVVFSRTGGLHAAGLFSRDGALLDLFEDVGRHNALDKLIGSHVLAGETRIPEGILALSGRASFELVQKALMARIPLIAAVGAPSSLAVQLADGFGQTLLGFVREDGFNVYAGRQRIETPRAPG
jgi:FdhD protein